MSEEYRFIVKQRVILQGGTGNQLFQWAYAHYLADQGPEIELVFPVKKYSLEHTSLSLGDFLNGCEHIEFKRKQLPGNRALRAFVDPSNSKFIFKIFPFVLQDTMDAPYERPKKIKRLKPRFHLGYYQNWDIPYTFRNKLRSELWKAINAQGESALETHLIGAEVIHIRHGDTTSAQNLATVGVLDQLYYKNLPAKGNTKRVVITDDIEGARETIGNIQVDEIFGPDDLNAYQALAVMSRSSRLFTANSTLSWWGGFLAEGNSAEIFIPNPFFRNIYPNPGTAFLFPNFQTLPSIFRA